MSKRQNETEVGASREYKLIAYIAPIGIVAEGSKVQLDGSQSYFEYNNNNNNNNNKLSASSTATRPITGDDQVSFFWEQIDGPLVTLENSDSATPSFTAPYIDLSNSPKKIHANLKFQLVIREKDRVLSDTRHEQ